MKKVWVVGDALNLCFPMAAGTDRVCNLMQVHLKVNPTEQSQWFLLTVLAVKGRNDLC